MHDLGALSGLALGAAVIGRGEREQRGDQLVGDGGRDVGGFEPLDHFGELPPFLIEGECVHFDVEPGNGTASMGDDEAGEVALKDAAVGAMGADESEIETQGAGAVEGIGYTHKRRVGVVTGAVGGAEVQHVGAVVKVYAGVAERLRSRDASG